MGTGHTMGAAAVGGSELLAGAEEVEGGAWGEDADLVLDDDFGTSGDARGDEEGGNFCLSLNF